MVGAAGCVIFLYGRPLIHLPPEVLSPMQRWLSMPHGKLFSAYGAVAVVPWLLLCDRGGSMLVRAMLPARRPRSVGLPALAATREGGFLSEGKKEQ